MDLEITMIPAVDDPDRESPAYQAELSEFAKSLKKGGVEYESKPGKLLLTDWAPFIHAGKFVVKMIEDHREFLVGAIGTWITTRNGRKVRLKVSSEEIEAEAQTIEQVEKLLEKAQEIQDRNRPKKIHEP